MLSEKLIEKLKVIILEDYGKDLPLPEVSKIGNDIVSYFDLLAQIHHKNKIEDGHE
jgi:hypothetical protein